MLNKLPFEIGDKVRTYFVKNEEHIIRTVTKVTKVDAQFGWWDSFYLICTDGGESCSSCGKTSGTPIQNIDASLFNIVKEEKC